jgi:hypothetical protein
MIVFSIEYKSKPASVKFALVGIFAASSIIFTLTTSSLDLYGENIFIVILYSTIINDTNAAAMVNPNTASNAINNAILSRFI